MSSPFDRSGAPPGVTATVTATAHTRRQLLAQRFHLDVVAGPDRGRRFVSERQRTVIGSHESADLVLTDTTVSRFHLEIVVEASAVVVRDLGSRNGTRLGRVWVREAVLDGPAQLEIGKTRIKVGFDRDPMVIALSERNSFYGLIGQSPAMRAVFATLESGAPSDATVLLEGETGTGKEVAAAAIHRASLRRDGPFVIVDCASLPPTLLESELFGHERGAFTGALTERTGAFEEAHGGTIFLDEIGELPLELQPKLLRALEAKQVSRIGSNRPMQCDFRVIAATNRKLEQSVNARRFRPDLYYRLAVLTVRLPPLRDRPEDVPLLVEHFLDELGAPPERRAAILALAPDLSEHSWPGNARELRNHVERLLALVDTEIPEPAPLPADAPPIDVSLPLREARARHLAWFEQRYLAELMRAHGGVVTAAARAAGVARVHLHRLLGRAGIR